MPIARDLRKVQEMTVAEADGIFTRLAQLTAAIKREGAAAEKRKAEVDLKAAETVAPLQREYEILYAELTDYIMAHPERFTRPRKHKVGQIGTYGIEVAPDKVGDVDPAVIAEFADAQGLQLYKTTVLIDKSAVAQAFRDGITVPGCRYTPPGDVPKIKVAPGYIEQQLKG